MSMENRPLILLVDDDPQALESMRKMLERSAYRVRTASDGSAALELLRPGSDEIPDVLITDVRMPRLGGMELLRAASICQKDLPVILMTAFGRVEDAVWAMKLGAVDFLTKPFKRQALLSSVDAALKRAKARNSAKADSRDGAPADRAVVNLEQRISGVSSAVRQLRGLLERVSSTEATILLRGESGTGKERVARTIHDLSARADGPFVALNCAAIPEQLIESELFGFEKGAFSGATGSKPGLFESASGGTLLLDEIGDMPLPLQAKLLRVLQEGEVRRLGSTRSQDVDVRVISATHRDLRESVRRGAFREDLLFRLEVVAIDVPPLRERMEDLLDLAHQFLAEAARRHDKPARRISEEAIEVLLGHDWPGNIRELSNVIERAVVFSTSELITHEDLPPHLLAAAGAAQKAGASVSGMLGGQSVSVPIGTPLREVEELLIRKTLEATAGDKNMTAKLLGVNSRTIYRKLEKRPEKGAEKGEIGHEPEAEL